MLHLILAALFSAQQTPSPAPSGAAATAAPSPTPSPTSAPPLAAGYDVTLFSINAEGANTADFSNLLLNLTANAGNFHGTATIGEYNFPTLGFPVTTDNAHNANTSLYSVVPVGDVQYSFNSHWSVAAGKFAALLGQESAFTYQNANIERGIGWSMEPVISNGVQAGYTGGPWTLTLQYNNAYYSSGDRAFEGLAGWAPSSNTDLQFAFIVPNANAKPNATVTVGNKAEYDLMYTRQIGKLQLLPYLLFVNSPASPDLGYKQSENAWAGVVIGTWTFSTPWSAALRYEYAANESSISDTGANADLIGFGPGSKANTFTITPTLHLENGAVVRLEYSYVSLSSFASGLGFGPSGVSSSQNRVGFEIGVNR